MELVVETDGGDPRSMPGPVGGSKAERREQVLAGVYRDKVVVLRRVARGLTGDAGVAEELVQDAFIRTLGARRAPEDPDELFFYLVRVVTNVSRSHLAKATRRAARRQSTRLDDRPGSASTAGSGPGAGDGPGDLADAVARLPQRQREVVFLRYWLDLGVEQTARTMGISAGAVKTHASRALSQLRGQLDELPDEPPEARTDDSEDDQP
jgi:RNA polymerase sigma factor (sigma-70 family)